MLIVLFDSQGIVHKEFMQEGCTVNAEYYKGVLDSLISRIQRVRPSLCSTHDFSSCTTPWCIQQQKFDSFWLKNKSQHWTTPILARFVYPDYFLFPEVKLQLKGARFDTIEEIQKAVTDKLNKISAEGFSNAMKKLETRANLCIASNGSYFE